MLFPVKVKEKFRDKNTSVIYPENSFLFVNEERFEEITKFVTKDLSDEDNKNAEKIGISIVREISEDEKETSEYKKEISEDKKETSKDEIETNNEESIKSQRKSSNSKRK